MSLLTSVGKVKGKNAVVGLEEGGVHLEVGRGAGERLNVDAPLRGVQIERVEGALLAERLDLVDVLVTSVVPGRRVALRILVRHD